MTKLTCFSESIGWNYRVTTSDPDFVSLIEFNFINDQGSITLNSSYYDIKHTGLNIGLSGKWSLELDGRVIAVAIKHPMSPLFEVSYDSQKLILKAKAKSSFTQKFAIELENGLLLGVIEHNTFIKSAIVDCYSLVEIPVQIFLFWLTVLMWKRGSYKNYARR